jgi:hypothetical protein
MGATVVIAGREILAPLARRELHLRGKAPLGGNPLSSETAKKEDVVEWFVTAELRYKIGLFPDLGGCAIR